MASAISLCALIASTVGVIPIIPTTAVTTISALSIVAASIRPSSPLTILTSISPIRVFNSGTSSSLPIHTSCGLNSRTCSARSATLVPAASATTLISAFLLITSNVCVPIEPVEPSIETFFIINLQRLC